MNERVVEILIYLMTEIRENHRGLEKVDGISKDLIRQGYTENEINTAFSWLFDRIKSDDQELYFKDKDIQFQHFRVLHDVERLVITPKSYGYLLQLLHLGLINQTEMELIIERALLLGISKVDINDIKSITASLFFNSDDLENNVLGKSLLDMDGVIH